MRATFLNLLVFHESGREDLIQFKHPYRVNVDMYICHRSIPGREWELRYKGQNADKIPAPIRNALMKEFRKYIRQRVKKNVETLHYDDFVEMAKAIDIAHG
jgi:hypothetical protein